MSGETACIRERSLSAVELAVAVLTTDHSRRWEPPLQTLTDVFSPDAPPLVEGLRSLVASSARAVDPGTTFELAFPFVNDRDEPVRLVVRFPVPAGTAFVSDSTRIDDRPLEAGADLFAPSGAAFEVLGRASRRISARYLVGDSAATLELQAAYVVENAAPRGTNLVRLIVRGGGLGTARATKRASLHLEHRVLGVSERGRRLRYVLTATDLSATPDRRAAVRLALPSGVEYRTGTTFVDGRPVADVRGVGPLWAHPGIVIAEPDPASATRVEIEAVEHGLLPAAVRGTACAELLFEDGRRSIVATDVLNGPAATGVPEAIRGSIGRGVAVDDGASRSVVRGRDVAPLIDDVVAYEARWAPDRMAHVARELATAGVGGLARHLFIMEALLAETVAVEASPLEEMREALRTVLERLFVRVQMPAANGAAADTERLREAASALFRAIRTERVSVISSDPARVVLYGALRRTEARSLETRLTAPHANETDVWLALAHLVGQGVKFGSETRRAPSTYRSMLIETLETLRSADPRTFHARLIGTPRPDLDLALEAALEALAACSSEADRTFSAALRS